MSLAQYASPYNDESEVDNNKNQKNQSGKKMSAATSSSLSSSSLRKTIKRPLQQQSQQSQSQQPQSQQPQSRVSDFMNKLNSHATTSTTSYIGDDDGGSPYGPYGDSEDLADYIPTTDQQQQQQQQQMNTPSNDNNNDNAVTKENFMDLPSSYAKQYYQQYIPHGQSAFKTVSENAPPQKDELLEKMNHIIHMLEEQQDEKTGNVTEELILYCFLGVFVIFVVDSFARAGKYVR
jgi:transcription initiation factor TFIID subunit TAF12